MHFQLFLATSFNCNKRKASKIPFHWVWNMVCFVYLARKLWAFCVLTCRLQHTSLHEIRRKKDSFIRTEEGKKKTRVVETVWMNKWLLHQENNGQSQLGDSWHMRWAAKPLSGATVFPFLILPPGVSTCLPLHYDTTNKQFRHCQRKKALKFGTLSSIVTTILYVINHSSTIIKRLFSVFSSV
jgi:hypothetical protein